MLPIQTVLHPTDFSDCSNYAFRLACSLARDYGARLVVLHVAEPPRAVSGDGLMTFPTATDLEPLRQQLQQLRSEDEKLAIEHRLAEGNVPVEILGIAKEIKCDLIVIGTHGRTGIGRLLMGSVAEQVVRKARCPVLTVKTPQHLAASSEEGGARAALKGAGTRE
jgi:nucleotide-binding universal stress UspA family protein